MPVSVVPHRAHVVASPQRRPLRPRQRLACQQVASAPPFARAAHSAMAHLLDRCGAFGRPTAMSTQQAAPFGTQTPAAHYSVACSSGREVHFPYRCGTLRPTPTRCPSSDGTPRRPNARGGFRPANAARTPPHFFPTCDAQEANLFIQVSVKSISASCRRTHRPPLRAVGHHPAGIGAVCSSFLSAPRRRDSNGPFFSSSGSARARRSARLPLRHPPPWRCPVRRSAAVPPRPSAAQSPESRLCGGLSASIHPLHSPHRPCPKIIVLRSASL